MRAAAGAAAKKYCCRNGMLTKLARQEMSPAAKKTVFKDKLTQESATHSRVVKTQVSKCINGTYVYVAFSIGTIEG